MCLKSVRLDTFYDKESTALNLYIHDKLLRGPVDPPDYSIHFKLSFTLNLSHMYLYRC